MTNVAAIDCGTNSIRLLIAAPTIRPDGTIQLTDIVRENKVVRLGYGVDRTGEFDPDALARTLTATREYADLISANGCSRIRFVATSATRDARNRDVFIEGVQNALGIEPEVISGSEEAQLSFAGAISAVSATASSPYLVADLGGGSTELVAGSTVPLSSYSMDIGSVRLTERYLDITDAEKRAEAITTDIDSALDVAEQQVDLSTTGTLIGVAGTITTVTAHALRLPRYDPAAINGRMLTVAQTISACQDLATMDRSELSELPYMHPGRVDIIGVGATIWEHTVRRTAQRVEDANGSLSGVLTSEHDILDGIALSIAQ